MSSLVDIFNFFLRLQTVRRLKALKVALCIEYSPQPSLRVENGMIPLQKRNTVLYNNTIYYYYGSLQPLQSRRCINHSGICCE